MPAKRGKTLEALTINREIEKALVEMENSENVDAKRRKRICPRTITRIRDTVLARLHPPRELPPPPLLVCDMPPAFEPPAVEPAPRESPVLEQLVFETIGNEAALPPPMFVVQQALPDNFCGLSMIEHVYIKMNTANALHFPHSDIALYAHAYVARQTALSLLSQKIPQTLHEWTELAHQVLLMCPMCVPSV